MNNKCGCGWEQGSYCLPGSGCQAGSAFVPVNSNWDFNMDGGCQQGSCRRQRQNCGKACQAAENTVRRTRQADCTSERSERRQDVDCNTCTRQADCASEHCERRREADCNTCTGRADCACETCARRREAECGKQKNTANNRGVSIVWAKVQELDNVYDCGRALKAGTLYPELHKPMNGYWPCGEECGDKCQQIAFAMWELRLYLNTHPCDKEALAMLHKLQTECCEPNYATTFLEDVSCCDGTRNPAWRWTRDPWPWEYEANCGC